MNNVFNLKVNSLRKKGKAFIISTDDGKYVLKESNNNYYEYLNTRGFLYFPEVIRHNDKYILTKYLDDSFIPLGQQAEDMIYLVSLLHLTTTYDKKIDLDSVKEIYENIISKLDDLKRYYLSLQDLIEDEIYMAPSNYLLIRNISIIYKAIDISRNNLDKWFNIVKDKKIIRYTYNHGNLDLDHLIENDKPYLISWESSNINMPIYDIDNFYRNNFNYIKLDTLLDIYLKKYVLYEEEIYLLFSILLIPNKLDINDKEYAKVCKVYNLINYYKNTLDVLKGYTINHNNQTNK